MKEVLKEMPDLDIVHRSFVLAWENDNLISMFGSLEDAKTEIMNHWEHANATDPLHRFNIERMKEQDFTFPTSKNPLLAAKAAGIIGGENSYWDVFDVLQEAMFVKSEDISSIVIIEKCIKETNIDFDKWKKQFENPITLQKINEDLQLVKKYNIQSVPTLVIDGKYLINGSHPSSSIISELNKIRENERK